MTTETKRPAGSWEAAQQWLRARDEMVDELTNQGFTVRDLSHGYGVIAGSRLVAAFTLDATGAFESGWVELAAGGVYLPHTTRESWSAAIHENHIDKKAVEV